APGLMRAVPAPRTLCGMLSGLIPSNCTISRCYAIGLDTPPQTLDIEGGSLRPPHTRAGLLLAVLAPGLRRTGRSTMTASLHRRSSVQALCAADSGAQYALHQTRFNGADNADAESRCTAVAGSSLVFAAEGLRNCSASFSCARLDPINGRQIFSVRSAARCGS